MEAAPIACWKAWRDWPVIAFAARSFVRDADLTGDGAGGHAVKGTDQFSFHSSNRDETHVFNNQFSALHRCAEETALADRIHN